MKKNRITIGLVKYGNPNPHFQKRKSELGVAPREILIWTAVQNVEWLKCVAPARQGVAVRQAHIEFSPKSDLIVIDFLKFASHVHVTRFTGLRVVGAKEFIHSAFGPYF